MVSSPGARFSADSCRNPTSGASSSTLIPPGSPVTVTRRGAGCATARVTSSHTSTRMPRTRSSSSSSRVPSSAASVSASCTRARSWAARSRRASANPVARRVPGADVAGSPLASLAYWRARLRVCWSSLRPEASGSSVEHDPLVVTERQRAAHPRVAGPRREHRAVDDHGRLPRREDLQVRRPAT